MELARNAVYGLHLKGGKGSTYAHLFHVNERGQIDIAMHVDQLVKGGESDKLIPDLIEYIHTHSHDHWLGGYKFTMLDSHVIDTRKLTNRDYRRMARKILKQKAQ